MDLVSVHYEVVMAVYVESVEFKNIICDLLTEFIDQI